MDVAEPDASMVFHRCECHRCGAAVLPCDACLSYAGSEEAHQALRISSGGQWYPEDNGEIEFVEFHLYNTETKQRFGINHWDCGLAIARMIPERRIRVQRQRAAVVLAIRELHEVTGVLQMLVDDMDALPLFEGS
eukprot:TRINITY_DN27998_c0_g1_i1.p1 TRINITY_DN27998_c0_g1~~TRINITY_DN27998_c0_g1_i1.p1  ORF type:complete len:135 (+),score=26.09 TRINITY_DN27998_c0_g1_i1:40-444(+)